MNLSKKMVDMKNTLVSLDFSGMRDDDSWNWKHENIQDIVHLLMDAYVRDPIKVSTRKKSLVNVIYYLFFIEGIYSFNINMIIYYEICNKSQELIINYGKNRNKKVTQFDELNDVSLSNRLNFLRARARWTFRGTHKGQFFSIPPSGKEVTYPIIGIYRIEYGRIAEDWHIFHALGLWQQLMPEIGELLKRARNTTIGNVDVHG